ncbi:MAG: beta-hydroxyacyl-ACP dehydratase [Planctomycetota bacterium]|nr:MAG: beta-hydroxyacyl-ACP dehydratase [Planctomycetota bacterium]
MPAEPFYSLDDLDFDRPVFTIEDIRAVNPQRYEMEQLTAILKVDRDNHGIVGYKEVTEHEFWVRGHMPDYPLMPGVIMCEAAAQLAGFYARKYKMMEGDVLAFGGMDDVRFRYPVRPPCRLVLMARLRRIKPKLRAEFDFQGFVEGRMCLNGLMIGVPMDRR